MKAIDSVYENGSINAHLFLEKSDLAGFSTAQKAVEYYIMYHAKALGANCLLFTRVTLMDEHEDGSIDLCFESAVSPKVVLGQYKGVSVDIGHCEDFEEAAITAAANNMQIELPLLAVERKLDTIKLEKETELMESVSINALADVYAILKKLDCEQDDDSRWRDAIETAETYLNMGMQDLDFFAECIGDVCFPAEKEEIEKAIEHRADERNRLAPEIIGDEIFEAYLRSKNSGMKQWREENRSEAERQCRADFLLSAVVDAESIGASDAELDKAAYDLAVQYRMSDKDVLAIVGDEALRQQIKMAKARRLIAESAKKSDIAFTI